MDINLSFTAVLYLLSNDALPAEMKCVSKQKNQQLKWSATHKKTKTKKPVTYKPRPLRKYSSKRAQVEYENF